MKEILATIIGVLLLALISTRRKNTKVEREADILRQEVARERIREEEDDIAEDFKIVAKAREEKAREPKVEPIREPKPVQKADVITGHQPSVVPEVMVPPTKGPTYIPMKKEEYTSRASRIAKERTESQMSETVSVEENAKPEAVSHATSNELPEHIRLLAERQARRHAR